MFTTCRLQKLCGIDAGVECRYTFVFDVFLNTPPLKYVLYFSASSEYLVIQAMTTLWKVFCDLQLGVFLTVHGFFITFGDSEISTLFDTDTIRRPMRFWSNSFSGRTTTAIPWESPPGRIPLGGIALGIPTCVLSWEPKGPDPPNATFTPRNSRPS